VRIALVTETWLPSIDGVVTRLHHTVRQLSAAGHDVLVLAPSTGTPIARTRQRELPGMILPFVDRSRRIGLPLPWSVTEPLDRFDPDVVHVVNPVLMGWAALRSIADRHSTVVSLHTDLEAYLSGYHLRALRPTLRALMRSAYGQADLALATSPYGQQRLLAVGVNSKLWPPGVDTDVFNHRPRPIATPTWLTDEPELSTAIYVGRLGPEKNLEMLAPVLGSARGGLRPWHLTFIGDGPERGRLERRFAGLPVTFAGARSVADVAAAYHAADVLLMPSLTETVGLVLLEGATCGMPVVAADTPAVRHTVQRGALLIPPNATPDRWAAAIAETLDRPRPEPAKVTSWREVTAELIEAYRWVAELRWPRRPGRGDTQGL
jgi:glycosyltransferase involved in cell wall biosynthesis